MWTQNSKEAQTTDKWPMEIMKDLNDESIWFNIQVNRLVVQLNFPKMGQPPGQPTKYIQYNCAIIISVT